ncbi:LAQU0S10e02454g1_1 [Lachancea quebecensis]|uniref:non-specific serine/threonine protein kinase n=1 Tax=Lachancea quebecensis TaxID=1654605 RepID=A0A0P1L2A3_9SACH|nr:LAQU0S10e02454g1_1 [Lachancea quebecensis]
MRRPRGIDLLAIFVWGLLLLIPAVSGSWLRWRGRREHTKESIAPFALDAQNAPISSLQNEVHRAKPTVFKKSLSVNTSSPTPSQLSEPLPSSGGTKTMFTSNSLLRNVHGFHDSSPPNNGVSVLFDHRKSEGLKILDHVIVTDLEGGLHAVHRKTGEILWSNTNVSAPSIHVSEPTDSSNETLIVEPYGDGNIYYFNIYQGLQKLPISIKHLVNASPLDLKTRIVVDGNGTTIDDEKIYTGSRHSAVFNINIKTGHVLSAYGPGTENKAYDDLGTNCTDQSFSSGACEDVLVLGRTTYELSIYSKLGTVYNVTYGAWQQNSADNSIANQYDRSADGILIAPFGEKSLLAVDSELKFAKWISSQFSGTINNVFDVFLDEKTSEKIILPHPMNPQSVSHHQNRVLLGRNHGGCWYAMSDEFYPSLVDSSSVSIYNHRREWKMPQTLKDVQSLQDAMVGVHDLQSLQFEQIIEHESLPSPKPLPASSMLLIDSPRSPRSESRGLIVEEDSTKALERYISKEEMLALKLQAKEKMAQDLLSAHQKSFAYRFANFVYRIVEGGLMLLFSFFILGLLSRFKVLAPLHVFLERSGIISSQNLETGSIKIEDKEDISVAQDDHHEKHVQILNPVSDIEQNSKEEGSSERRKRKRGSRGKKKNRKGLETSHADATGSSEAEIEADLKHLTVSKKILGYGSSGTVVFQGTFQHRPVAVKRMLIDFYDIATQEIKLLTESDHHPNVVRYYCSEVTGRFLYIALELCTSTLEDVVEGKKESSQIMEARERLDPINVLFQIAQGVAHLHSMKIVHRDLKPQNILVAPTRKYMQHLDSGLAPMRVLISDFGLCKRLEPDQSSFHTKQGNASGTSGWRAPELLDGCATSDTENDASCGSAESSESYVYDSFYHKRLTRAIDIFSMGCVFYYVLSKGSHPFGDKYSRDSNILKESWCLDDINKSLKDRCSVIEAKDLITQMISNNPGKRPAASQLIKHPIFWPISRKLEFLLKVSDRFEVERRVPPSPLLLKLEEASPRVIPNRDWTVKFDGVFMENLGKYRKYSGEKLMDLLRAFRNKYHHFMDLPPELAEVMGPIPDGFYLYFARRFPNLLLEIYFVVQRNLKHDQILGDYF